MLEKKEINGVGCSGGNTCGCQQKSYGLCGGCGAHKQAVLPTEMSRKEQELIAQLEVNCYLPVVQFLVQDTTDPMFKMIAFSPVYIEQKGETIEAIRDTGKCLAALQKRGVLTLDYEVPLQGYAYEEYIKSDAFQAFVDGVAEEMWGETYTGIYPTIQKGSMALTQKYIDSIDDFAKEREV